MSDAPRTVLIVGAGPTGLVLALWLAHMKIPVRIIDKTSGPGTTSRAFAVQARTLELYRQIPGLAEDVVGQGIIASVFNLWSRGKRRARVEIGHFGEGLSPFPFILVYPQDAHENLLISYLAKAGVTVEREAELIDFSDKGTHVTATIRKTGGEETADFVFLCGCDGAHGTVRKKLGIGFPGGTYEQIFYVTDVAAQGEAAQGEPCFCLEEKDFCLVFPMRGSDANVRLVGIVPMHVKKDIHDITFDDVAPEAKKYTGLEISKVNWFSTYHSHHRVAERFSQGRVFLLGDAAHIHSPAGGQGMNTGIGDAINLAWKIRDVLTGRASLALLETYGQERISFAQRLVSTTDRIFTGVTQASWFGKVIRTKLMPVFFTKLLKWNLVREFMFRAVSQLIVNYQKSLLSNGKTKRIKSGDRLPWVGNHEAISYHWHIQIHGVAKEELYQFCQARSLPLHVFAWSRAAEKAGISRNALYLIRPDGYTAFIDSESDLKKLGAYLATDLLTSH